MHTYVIKKGTILEPFAYQVISKNKYKFADIHQEVNNYQGNLNFGLSSLGDIVRLYNAEMEMVNFLSYGVNTPWPIIPSGSGYTLSLLNPDKDNFLSTSWRVSNEKYGTPGSQNFTGTVDIDLNPAIEPDQLFQNSPNPFNRSTRIILYSSTYQAVKLSVYDLNGRLVDVLADQNMPEGHHEIDWTPEDSGSGMFILRMETANTVLTKRIMRTQ